MAGMATTEDGIATLHRRKSGGHYARVMGTLHRHLKVEKAGDAALGMLTRIWSYCADNGREVLTERDMAVIMVRDKNGPRKLKALLEAELIDRVPGGYTPHDWFDHNPGIKPKGDVDRESYTRDGESIATENVTLIVTENARNSGEQNQQVTQLLSRPRTQDPGIRSESADSGAELELEHGEPDAPLADRVSLLALVRIRVTAGYDQHGGAPPWTKNNLDHIKALAAWLEPKGRCGADYERMIARVLAGFFVDERMIGMRYPLAFLASDAAKWMSGASTVGAAGTTTALEARLRELQAELRKYQSEKHFSSDEQKRVEREIGKVERQIRELEPKRAESYAR